MTGDLTLVFVIAAVFAAVVLCFAATLAADRMVVPALLLLLVLAWFGGAMYRAAERAQARVEDGRTAP